jgi:hypothetical protein
MKAKMIFDYIVERLNKRGTLNHGDIIIATKVQCNQVKKKSDILFVGTIISKGWGYYQIKKDGTQNAKRTVQWRNYARTYHPLNNISGGYDYGFVYQVLGVREPWQTRIERLCLSKNTPL